MIGERDELNACMRPGKKLLTLAHSISVYAVHSLHTHSLKKNKKEKENRATRLVSLDLYHCTFLRSRSIIKCVSNAAKNIYYHQKGKSLSR